MSIFSKSYCKYEIILLVTDMFVRDFPKIKAKGMARKSPCLDLNLDTTEKSYYSGGRNAKSLVQCSSMSIFGKSY